MRPNQINETKRQPINLEKIFANNVTNKELIFKICKELTQLNVKKKKKNQNTGQRPKQTFFQRYTDG